MKVCLAISHSRRAREETEVCVFLFAVLLVAAGCVRRFPATIPASAPPTGEVVLYRPLGVGMVLFYFLGEEGDCLFSGNFDNLAQGHSTLVIQVPPGATGDRAKEVGAGTVNEALEAVDWISRKTGIGSVDARVEANTNPQTARERANAQLNSEKAEVTKLTKEFVRDAISSLNLDFSNMTERQLAEALRRADITAVITRVYERSRLAKEYGKVIWTISKASGKSFQDMLAEEMRGAVRTVGPMQVDIEKARDWARAEGKEMTAEEMEKTLYTLDGGLHYGVKNVAELFKVYEGLSFEERVKFIAADENAGEYACRNAQIQNYLNELGRDLGVQVSVDGDMLRWKTKGISDSSISGTESALRLINDKLGLGLTNSRIRSDLEGEKQLDFQNTETYQTIVRAMNKKMTAAGQTGWKHTAGKIPDIEIQYGVDPQGRPIKISVRDHADKIYKRVSGDMKKIGAIT